jgi:hypothetical protein
VISLKQNHGKHDLLFMLNIIRINNHGIFVGLALPGSLNSHLSPFIEKLTMPYAVAV